MCLGLLPGFPRHSAGPPLSPPPRVCFDRKRAAGGERLREDVGGVGVQTPVRPLDVTPQGKAAGSASEARIQPLASQGWLVFSKAAPLGGTTGVNSADLRWHVDERGYVFSLVLGKAASKREISQCYRVSFKKINVLKCKNLVKIKKEVIDKLVYGAGWQYGKRCEEWCSNDKFGKHYLGWWLCYFHLEETGKIVLVPSWLISPQDPAVL